MAAVFLSDPVEIDLHVYLLWLKGLSTSQIVKYQCHSLLQDFNIQSPDNQVMELLGADISSKCHALKLLEPYLKQPGLLLKQMRYQVSPEVQKYMVCKYYQFDDIVIRELLGRKLTTRARKDLDEVVESTGIPLRSCRRQFDNLRAIFNALDDRNFEGNLVFIIETLFLVPTALSRRYTCLIFLLYNKFSIRAHDNKSVKKTAIFSCSDLEYFAGLILATWNRVDEFLDSVTGAEQTRLLQLKRAQLSSHSTVEAPNTAKKDLQTDGSFPSPVTDDPTHRKYSESLEAAFLPSSPTNFSSPPPNQSWSPRSSLRLDSAKPESKAFKASIHEDAFSLAHQIPNLMKHQYDGNTVDLDPKFTSQLRDLRAYLMSNKSVLDHVQRNVMVDIVQSIGNNNADSLVLRKIRPKFRQWLKSLLNIGSGLAQGKEFRDIFEDVLVQLTFSILDMKLNQFEAATLFEVTRDEISRMLPKYSEAWIAYVYVTMRIALIGMERST